MPTPESKKQTEMRFLAWETSVKRLDFEINLLWRRGAYFWAFIAPTFAAYYALSAPELTFERAVIASFGFLLSMAWCLANMGSKYWQTVWEEKVKVLELETTGKLYGCIPAMTNSPLVKRFRFSVSRISIAVSALTACAWLAILVDLTVPMARQSFENYPQLLLVATLVGGALLAFFCHSKDRHDHPY